MEPEELEVYFNEFLDKFSDKPRTLKLLKQLYELSYRQWDTYELLTPQISERVSEYVLSAINFKSYDIMDTIISIVENLSLQDVFNYIISKKDAVNSPSVKKLIAEAEEEYSDVISNPYGSYDDW